jgi:hypothetical protein
MIGCFFGGGGGWFLAGAWWIRRLGEKYPPAGAVNMPSPEVTEAAFALLLTTPFTAIMAGLAGGILVRSLLLRKTRATS